MVDYETTTNSRVSSLEGKVGKEAQSGQPATGLTLDVRTLQTTVGNNSSGLVKSFNDLNKIDLYAPSKVTGKTIKFKLTDLQD